MILIFEALLAGYIFWRAILPLRLHWGWKAALSALLAVAAFKFHLLHLFGGPMFFSPVLPEWLLLAAAWLFSVLFLFFFLLLAADIVGGLYRLVLFCLRKKKSERFRTIVNRVNLGLLVLSSVLATVGVIGGTSVPGVREETIAVGHLPEEADGMTIALLADLHADGITRADRIRRIVQRTNSLNPDLVVIAGDFVDGTVPVHGEDLRPLADLKARYGVFGVPGNHEYYSGYEDGISSDARRPDASQRTCPDGRRKRRSGGSDGSRGRDDGQGRAGYRQGSGRSAAGESPDSRLPPAAPCP